MAARAPRSVDQIVADWRAQQAAVARAKAAKAEDDNWRTPTRDDLAVAKVGLAGVPKAQRSEIVAVHIGRNGWVRYTMRDGAQKIVDPVAAPAVAAHGRIVPLQRRAGLAAYAQRR